MGDLNAILERVIALRQALIGDGMMNGVPFTDKDRQTLVERLTSEGSSFVKVTLPKLGKALDGGLISGGFNPIADFACKKGTNLPRFLHACFKRVFDTDGVLRSNPCITTIYFLRQFLLLDSKLEKAYTPEQERAAVDGFRLRQEKLGKTRLPCNHPVLSMAQRLLTRMMKRCDLSNILPGHGPGGVAEGYDRFTRWDIRAWPKRAERWYPFNVYGSQSFQALCFQGAPVMVSNSITKCSLVPKDFKGPRLISSESTATQYLQQGQMKLLMHYVDSHWLMSKSIRFRDQTHNQEMCRQAYDSGTATLDLSNASDTVSAALVWYLLAGVPRLRSQLFSTRSQYMDVKGERIRITAFSPMGSAVCFPVETLVFWALTMASVRFVQHHWRDGSKDPTLPSESEMASAIAVFGDDILVPDYALAVLVGTLTEVGCEVNTSKTCYQTPFRESCGAEYFNHTDVAIIRNRRYDYEDSNKFTNYPAVLDLQRKFFLCGLFTTAALLREIGSSILPTLTQTPPGLYPRLLQNSPERRIYFEEEAFRLHPVGRQGLLERRRHDSSRIPGTWPSEYRLTAVPSGMDRFAREAGAFDRLCCCFGQYNSLDREVRIRYNAKLQRYECRLLGLFQRTKPWPLPRTASASGSDSFESGGARSSISAINDNVQRDGSLFARAGKQNRFVPEKARPLTLDSGYPRLLSRVVGDSVERIAIRDVMSKMAWSELPFYYASQRLVR